MKITETAPTKINLGLKIIGQRDDGFHNILSVFQTISLFDKLSIEKSQNTTLSCDYPGLPKDSGNIIIRAEKLIKEKFDIKDNFRFVLKKKIPAGAGLGGGSSDAAAAIRGLLKLYNIDITETEKRKLASELGSDVPFLISGGTAVISGRGEIIENIGWPFDFFYVLVYPNFGVSTSWAYKSLKKGVDIEKYMDMTLKLKKLNIEKESLLDAIENDFEDTVFKEYPILAEIKNNFLVNGASASVMSGSGSTIIGIFENENTASFCCNLFSYKGYKSFLAKKY